MEKLFRRLWRVARVSQGDDRAGVNGCWWPWWGRRGFLSLALRAWMGAGVTREGAIQARSAGKGPARRTLGPHPAQRPVAFMISSVRMIATPISDSPAISPLDTGTV